MHLTSFTEVSWQKIRNQNSLERLFDCNDDDDDDDKNTKY